MQITRETIREIATAGCLLSLPGLVGAAVLLVWVML